ncbi:MAG: hypothetical protein NTY90_00130 [Candidatus Micrarchaeota archaeon]|nr:hypothetical protein [Candidatus Micrarchaeota archaeon]
MVSLLEVWMLLLLAAAVSLILLPVVFVTGFFYEVLCKKYSGVPKILWMLLCIFAAAFAILLIIELAAGSVIFETAGALAR